MKYGNVKWYNSKKGYGFIESDNENKDVFIHVTQLERIGINRLLDGQRVGFETYSDRGRIAAGNIILM